MKLFGLFVVFIMLTIVNGFLPYLQNLGRMKIALDDDYETCQLQCILKGDIGYCKRMCEDKYQKKMKEIMHDLRTVLSEARG